MSFNSGDGDRSQQAAITYDFNIIPVPHASGTGADCYPAKPEAGMAVALRGDLALIPTKNVLAYTSNGPMETGVVTTMANRPRPEPGQEDEWCAEFIVGGVVKNELTDPNSAMFIPNGGVPRIASTSVAVQAYGGITVPYNNPELPVQIGNAVIYGPPAAKGINDYSREDRPIPTLGPLHWSMVKGILRNICIAMLKFHEHPKYIGNHGDGSTDYSEGDAPKDKWLAVAKERKRSILVTIMVGLWILFKRGFISILTPSVTKETAVKDRFIHQMRLLSQSGKGKIDSTTAEKFVEQLENSLNAVKEQAVQMDEERGNNASYYSHDPLVSIPGNPTEDGIRTNRRDDENLMTFTIARTTYATDLHQSEVDDRSLDWMIGTLGLGGSNNRIKVAKNTITDILEMHSSQSLNEEDSGQLDSYFTSTRNAMIPRQPSDSITTFFMHVRNAPHGENMTYQMIRDMVTNRIVGYALSSSNSTQNASTAFNASPTVDLVLGGRQM
jgi:hypothetical protein